ncbi:hypothetical protein R3P38DRAFT_3091770 [Favolaschia claudopus]|uniref:F-box domain-containing protein n=1 Tax=Favolaschia claudopus TaxID=2862362 RepID=A0AAV9ZSD0_9AGAR
MMRESQPEVWVKSAPTEVLTEIFHHAREDDSSQRCLRLPDAIARLANSPILSLSKVCSRWHTIALGSQGLWSTICAEGVLWTSVPHMAEILDLLHTALVRSGSTPLNIRAYGHIPPSAFAILESQMHRWSSVVLRCSWEQLELNIDRVDGLRNLRALTIRAPALQAPCTARWTHAIGQAPNLEQLSISQPFTPIVASTVLKRLRHCAWDLTSPTELTEVLSSMEFLGHTTTLRLAIYMDEMTDLWDDPILHVSNICSDVAVLQLGVPTEVLWQNILKTVFQTLTLPCLAELAILTFFRYDYMSWPHAEFLDMAHRSDFASHLTKLDIAICIVKDEELLDILSMTCMLQELCIADHSFLTWEHIVITNSLLEWLSQSTSLRVPNLASLDVVTRLRFDDCCLFDMLRFRSRCRGFSCYLRYHRDSYREVAVSRDVDDLIREQGLLYSCEEVGDSWSSDSDEEGDGT